MLGQLSHVVVVPGHAVGERFARVLMEEHVENCGFLPEGSFDPQGANLDTIQAAQIGEGLLNGNCSGSLQTGGASIVILPGNRGCMSHRLAGQDG